MMTDPHIVTAEKAQDRLDDLHRAGPDHWGSGDHFLADLLHTVITQHRKENLTDSDLSASRRECEDQAEQVKELTDGMVELLAGMGAEWRAEDIDPATGEWEASTGWLGLPIHIHGGTSSTRRVVRRYVSGGIVVG